ncbi:MAG: hypothetical protein DRP29_04745 [Thermodesulfobacteriota bacterium]|nr:MAG: hypothetical protein DRP29_04745 [Thermodesulfobacteriota bacterium]
MELKDKLCIKSLRGVELAVKFYDETEDDTIIGGSAKNVRLDIEKANLKNLRFHLTVKKDYYCVHVYLKNEELKKFKETYNITQNVQSIYISISKDDYRRIEEFIKECNERVKQLNDEQFEKEIKRTKTILFAIGGDTGKIYASCDELSERARASEKYSKFIEKVEKAIDRVIAKSESFEDWFKKLNVEKTDIRTALYNTLFQGGYWGRIRLNNEYLQQAFKEIEEEEKRKKEELERKRKELEEKRKKALEEAKKTGKEVIIRCIGGYDGDEVHPGCEYGWVNIFEVATPNGEIKEKHIPSY